MPPAKKRAAMRAKTTTAQATATNVHLSVAQKIGVAIALLAGFSAIAAGFAALPRRPWQRPPRENPPAQNERQERREAQQKQTSNSSASTLQPGVSIASQSNPETARLITGQHDVVVLTAELFAIADDVVVKEVTFRVNPLGAVPKDGIADAFTSFELSSNGTPWGNTVVFADNGFITFSQINQTIEQGKTTQIQLKADIVDAVLIDKSIFGQPFALTLETGIKPPEMVGEGSLQNAVIEGEAQSQPYILSRALLSQSFSADAGKVSPEGFATKSFEQTVAIIKVSNTSPNGYEAHLADFRMKNMAEGVEGTGTVRVYKDAITASNLLGEYQADWSAPTIALDDVAFKDVVVAPGASRYLYVTRNTANPSISANDTICMQLSESVTWTDGAKLYTDLTTDNKSIKCLTY